MKKQCRKHGLTEYSESETRPRCRKCLIDSVNTRRRKLKQMSIEYLGGSCVKCGYNKYVGALTFHHINPSEKGFSISESGSTRSWLKLKTELDKCQLLCANCHAELHHCDHC